MQHNNDNDDIQDDASDRDVRITDLEAHTSPSTLSLFAGNFFTRFFNKKIYTFTFIGIVLVLLFLTISIQSGLISAIMARYSEATSTTQPEYNNVKQIKDVTTIEGKTFVAAPDGTLTAYRSSDGKMLWRQKLSRANLAIAVDGGHLFAFADGQAGGWIAALNINDGSTLWTHELPGSGIRSLLPGKSVATIHAYDGMIYTLNSDDGSILWRYESDQQRPTDTFLWNVGDFTSIQTPDMKLHVFGQKSGVEILRYTTSEPYKLYADKQILYSAPNQNTIHVYDTGVKKTLWEIHTEGPLASWTVNAGIVYTHTRDGVIKAYRVSDQKTIWQSTTGGDGAGNIIVQQKTVLIQRLYSKFTALSTENGAQQWTRQLTFPLVTFIGHDNSLVFIGERTIEVCNVTSGVTNWKFAEEMSRIYRVRLTGDILHVQRDDGNVDVFNIQGRRFLWSIP